jgi:flagellar basal-body rod protein FlgF
MGETTLIHLSRMIGLERKLDVLARNVANANTAGFRSREISFREYLKPEQKVDENGKKERPSSLVDPGFQFSNSSQGALQPTGNPLDLAIHGEGYFVVRTAQGDRYTRAGTLTIDGSGRIVTLTGEPVVGKNGPLQVPQNDGEISVAADGTVSTKRTVVGQLRLVSFTTPKLLQPAGENLLRTDQSPIDLAPGQVRLISGALEKSNVETTREMSRLAEIVRSYEMVGRLLKNSQAADDINKLANVPE